MTTDKEKRLGKAPAGERRARMSLVFRRCVILLLLALTFQAGARQAAAQDRLTKLDKEPLVVYLENGSGAADVKFILAQGADAPKYTVTAAVGGSNTIPAGEIRFYWVKDAQPGPSPEARPSAEGQQGAARAVLAGQLSVNTHVNVEPNTDYKGRVIFYWPDAAQPVTMDFTISDRTTLAFSLAPTKLDLTFVQSQPDTITLRVKNTGRAAIRKLSVSSFDLLDAETQRRLVLPEQVKDFGSSPLAPSQEAEVSFNAPRPIWAGSYAGTVDVAANDRAPQPLSFTVRSRGPILGGDTYWVPFILFVATLALGYLLSTVLENWFNLGGLQRAEAQLSLRKSERELARVAAQVEKFGRPPEVFAQTRVRLQHDLNGLSELQRRLPDLTREELVAEAKRFATSATLAGVFESAVNVALKQWPDNPAKLDQVLTLLDREPPGTDPNAYRAKLRSILENAAASPEADEATTFDASAALPDGPTPADLEKQIKWMAHLERLVAAMVVFIMAYQLYYAKDYTFGTLTDYISVFLWSLGLTQMGTQIITRARSSQTPSQ